MSFPIEIWLAVIILTTLMKLLLVFFEVNTLSPSWATGLVLLILFSFIGQNMLFLAAVPVFLMPPIRWSWKPVFRIKLANPLILALSAAVGFGAWWLRAGILTFAYRILDLAPGKLLELDYQSGTWGTLLLVGLLIPIFWETVFRGFIQSAYEALTPHWNWLWTGILFGIVFIGSGLPGIAAALILGLVLGWLVWKTGSLWPAVIAHIVHNGTGLFFADRLQAALYATQLSLAPIAGAALGLVLIALALTLIANRAKAEVEPLPLDPTKITVGLLLPLLIFPLLVSQIWPQIQTEMPVLKGKRLLAQGEFDLAAEHLAKLTFAAGAKEDTELKWLSLEAYFNSGRLYDAIRLLEQMKVLNSPRWMTQAQAELCANLAAACYSQGDMYWAARLWFIASEARYKIPSPEDFEHALAHTLVATARWDVRHRVDSDSWALKAMEKHVTSEPEGALALATIYINVETLYATWTRENDLEKLNRQAETVAAQVSSLKASGQDLTPDLRDFALEVVTVADAIMLGIQWQQMGLGEVRTELSTIPAHGLEWLLTTKFASSLSNEVWNQVGSLRPDLAWRQLDDFRHLNGMDSPTLPSSTAWNAELLLQINGIGASWSADKTYLAMTSPIGGIHTHLWPVSGTEHDINTLQGRVLWAPQGQTYVWEQMNTDGIDYWLVDKPGQQGRQLDPEPNRVLRWLDQDSVLISLENLHYRYYTASSELEPAQYEHSLRWLSPVGMLAQRLSTGLVLLDAENNSLAQLNYPISQTFLANDNPPLWSPSGTSFVFSYSERRLLPRRHWLLSEEGASELKLPPHTHIVGWLSDTQLVGYQDGEENQWLLVWDVNTGDYGYVNLIVTAPDWQFAAGPGNDLITDGSTGNVYRLLPQTD